MAKKILFIIGSFRRNSFNKALSAKAAEIIGERASISVLDYKDVPYMDQDLEADCPAPVAAARAAVMEADGIWIFTPEYNHSYPGLLKNLLDWLSRPLVAGDRHSGTAIAGKKVAMSGAGGKFATADCRTRLTELLLQIRAVPMEAPQTGIALGAESFKSDSLILTDADASALAAQAEAFLEFIA